MNAGRRLWWLGFRGSGRRGFRLRRFFCFPSGGFLSFLCRSLLRCDPLPFGDLLRRRMVGHANAHRGNKKNSDTGSGHESNGFFGLFPYRPYNQQDKGNHQGNAGRNQQEAENTYHAEHPPSKDADTTTDTSVPPHRADGASVTEIPLHTGGSP